MAQATTVFRLVTSLVFAVAITYPSLGLSQTLSDAQTYGLSGNVAESGYPTGYSGHLTVTCTNDPGQTAGYSGGIGSTSKGLQAQMQCEGPVEVEGYVVTSDGNVTCTPFQYTDPVNQPGMNWANWQSLEEDGSSVRCAMTASGRP